MDHKQLRRAKKLIRKLCCNYDHGNCLALDDGEPCVCVQGISYSLLCNWFRNAVLPADHELLADVMRERPGKCCAVCGKPVYMTHFSFVGTVFARISHTSPTNAATFVSRGCGGYTRHPSP